MAGASVALWRHLGSRAPAAVEPSRRSVAVLGFRNASGQAEAAWLSAALAEALTARLAAGGELRLVPGDTVARMRIELSVPDADTLDRGTLDRIRSHLGSDVVVLGSYVAVGRHGDDPVRLELRAQDAARGTTLAKVSETGAESDLMMLVSRAGSRLRSQLGMHPLSASEESGLRASLPSSADAARLYAEGLEKLRRFDALAARERLEQALAADPDSPLAHSALAAAWSALGDDARARDEATKALKLAGRLTREDRLLVEARHREALKDWAGAVEAYRTLWALALDDAEHGLRLAAAQTSAGKASDALATVAVLRRWARAASDDPRIDLAEARAAEALSENRRSRTLAAQAAEKARAVGARVLLARARLQEGWTLVQLGQHREADEAWAWAVVARALGDLGRRSEAAQAEGEALRIAGRSQNLPLRLAVAVACARVRAASGRCDLCGSRALSAPAEANRVGLVGHRLEAGLALGEIEWASGERAAARGRLQALEAEAAAKGFRLIAGKARKKLAEG